jgi:hypothetical protein
MAVSNLTKQLRQKHYKPRILTSASLSEAFIMQAIEIETDISHDGHIRLSESLHSVFGRHARLILLLDDTKSLQTSPSGAILAFRGSGKGGSTMRLLADRQRDSAKER